MRKWAVALAALWMVMGSPPVSLGAEGVTLPKDLPLPTDASVAIYLPKHIREFRNPFRSGGGFQTTNALQLGASFEELTLGAAQHFFKTSFMYERSEERRVGEECRSRYGRWQGKRERE